MRNMGLSCLAALAGALAVVGCGTRSFAVAEAPREPFRAFGTVEVRALALPEDAPPEARDMALFIEGELRDRLAKKTLFPGEGRTLVLGGRLAAFDPGSQALRWLISFGAGAGEIAVEVTLSDGSGAPVARGTARGTVCGGCFGGTIESAGRRVARAILQFLEENYEELRPTLHQ